MTLSAEDKQEIIDLHARYYLSTDEKDVNGYMSCWVDDDEIVFESVFGNFTGRQLLKDFEDEHTSRGMAVGKRHLLGNVSIRVGENEDTAYATSYMIVMDVINVPQIVATGIYRDSKIVKTKEGWKFRHRKLEVDPGYEKLMKERN